nr:MAG TPA: hypothetical protein [Caudoviricetes sp.]
MGTKKAWQNKCHAYNLFNCIYVFIIYGLSCKNDSFFDEFLSFIQIYC